MDFDFRHYFGNPRTYVIVKTVLVSIVVIGRVASGGNEKQPYLS